MKKIVTTFALIAAIALGTQAQAQNPSEQKDGKFRQMERYKDLNLSDAQKTDIKKINTDFRAQMETLNKNENITVKEMKEKKIALQKERQTAFQNVLTPEQKTKFQEMKKEAKAKRTQRSHKPAIS